MTTDRRQRAGLFGSPARCRFARASCLRRDGHGWPQCPIPGSHWRPFTFRVMLRPTESLPRGAEGTAMLVLRYAFWAISRLLFALRYRIRVHGRDRLRGLRGPTLILPNHPGHIDPPLVFAALWPTLRRPTVYEGNFQKLLPRMLAKIVNAVPVPDLERTAWRPAPEPRKLLAGIVEGLPQGREPHPLARGQGRTERLRGSRRREGTRRRAEGRARGERRTDPHSWRVG